jgi:hypothetical protein
MAENQKMMQQIEQKGAEAGDEAAESEPEPGPTTVRKALGCL